MTLRHHLIPRLSAALAVIAATAGWGCNILAPAAFIMAGPGKVDAAYKLEDRPTVVFIDDRHNTLSPVSLRQVIADRLTQDLMQKAKVTNAIDPGDALAVARRHDRHESVLPIDAVGRAVGAEQVVYVELVAFVDSPDGITPTPTSVANVKVIDVANQKRLFPAGDDLGLGQAAITVSSEIPPVDPELLRSRSSRLRVHTMLAEETGATIARLFYKHSPRELGRNLDTTQ
jgi:hypothetical protein